MPSLSNNWEVHNIPREIGEYSEEMGLDCICTGGGCDFIFRDFPCGVQAILSCPEGGCPDYLDEVSSVVVYQDKEWATWVEYQFPDAKSAILR